MSPKNGKKAGAILLAKRCLCNPVRVAVCQDGQDRWLWLWLSCFFLMVVVVVLVLLLLLPPAAAPLLPLCCGVLEVSIEVKQTP